MWTTYVLSNCKCLLCCCVCCVCVTRRAGDLFGQRNILLKAKAVLTRGLAGVDNVYTQVCAVGLQRQRAAAIKLPIA